MLVWCYRQSMSKQEKVTATGHYDPAMDDVEGVVDALSEASPEEQDRIFDAERQGKARKTILDLDTREQEQGGNEPGAVSEEGRQGTTDPVSETASFDSSGEGKPVWDVRTHGNPPLGREDDYRVLGRT